MSDHLQAKSEQGSVIVAAQCKMARAATGLGVRELSELSGVSTDTIVRFESGKKLYPRTIAAIRAALEAAGVVFIEENGQGPGVRLKKTSGTV